MTTETTTYDNEYYLPDYLIGNLVIHHPDVLQRLRDRKITITVTWLWEEYGMVNWQWKIENVCD
jgi:hypothetical protein